MRFRSLLLSALLAMPLHLMADTFSTFTLTDVTFQSGAVSTGTVVFDTTTGIPIGFDVTYTKGSFSQHFNSVSSFYEEYDNSIFSFISESPDGARDFLGFTLGINTPVGYQGGPVCTLSDRCFINDVGFVGGYDRPGLDVPGDLMETGSLVLTSSDSTSPVPEPSSMMLLGTGILGAIGMLRKH